ncbi:dTDP-fucopyranose mutase [Microbotryomycetes sp. JL221]|nr:dTDP-fucopyranose mutase [Microbotryomycetes sp. JL221]
MPPTTRRQSGRMTAVEPLDSANKDIDPPESTAAMGRAAPSGSQQTTHDSPHPHGSQPDHQHEQDSDSSQDSDSTTDSTESSTDQDQDDDSDQDPDDDDDETRLHLHQLLLKAKQSARQQTLNTAATQQRSSTQDTLARNDQLVLFDNDEDDHQEDPQSSSATQTVPLELVQPLKVVSNKGKQRATDDNNDATITAQPLTLAQTLGGGGVVIEATSTAHTGDRWGRAPMQPLSKKQFKARQPKTTGPQWFNMPTTEITPEIKREIQAMRLRNALDPKRFYKSSSKQDKQIPEFFQMGHVIESNRSASTATPAIAKKRTFVEELISDEQSKLYAKKKTNEIMSKHMSGRKGANRKGSNKKARRR